MKKEYKYIIVAIVVILVFLLGLYIGRKTVKITESVHTEYITLPPIHDSIEVHSPIKSVSPDTAKIIQDCVRNGLYAELFPYKEKTDTIYTERDTAAVLKDWATERRYTENLFDEDTLGTCEIDIKVQYNRLSSIGYTYRPIQKHTELTVINEKMFEPFLGAGVTIGIDKRNNKLTEGISVQGGAFIKQNYGVSIQYQYMFGDIHIHEITGHFIYKF